MRAISILAGTLVVVFGVSELGFRRLAVSDAYVYPVVDVQQPGDLLPTLRLLRDSKAEIKVAVLGDSLIQGDALFQHGDDGWRSHTLPAHLERKLAAHFPDKRVTVANLGINGARIADYEELVRLLGEADIDLVVFDIHLRSFSGDFSSEEDALARPWLRDLQMGGRPISALWSGRRFFQTRLTNADPFRRASGFRSRFLVGSENSEDGDLLLLRLVHRYSSIDLSDSSAQVKSLRRLMAKFEEVSLPAVIFYAFERPDLRRNVLDDEAYGKLVGELDAHFRDVSGMVRYVEPLESMPNDCYLDILHLNSEGLERLADHLFPYCLDQMQLPIRSDQ